METPIRVLIVDDHFVVREGLKTIVLNGFKLADFGEAASAQEALDQAARGKWHLILLDVSMPGRGGLDVLKQMRQDYPKVPVIIVSMHPEEQFALRVLKLGASAYIRKDCAGSDLIKAMEAALRGQKYITPSIAERLAVSFEKDHTGLSHESLSDREYQVMVLLSNGKTVKEVGAELSLSVKTVSTYRARVLEKMSLENNAQLMRYAVRHGLVNSAE